jgi:hypothetical protein
MDEMGVALEASVVYAVLGEAVQGSSPADFAARGTIARFI